MSATPGPWEVGSDFVGPLKVMTTKDRHVVALVGDTKFVQAEANAHLIAAAPSMLIALKQIKEHCPCDYDATRQFNVAWALLEAAIAKAEGR